MNPSHLFDKYAQELQHSITQYAPKAWGLLVQVNQVDAITFLSTCASVLIISLIACLVFSKICKDAFDKDRAERLYDQNGKFYTFVSLSWVAGSICTIAFLVIALSPWAWVTVFNPQLGTVHRIISSAESKLSIR